MVARVTQYRIRPGKIEEFSAAVESMSPALDKFHGFRILIVLRGPEKDSRDATTISLWDSEKDLHATNNDEFYYHAIANLMKCCESFSPMQEQEVLMSKFAGK